ncbi:hypothetical protein SRHO_G00210210 [Serrasalmus rhombeus]
MAVRNSSDRKAHKQTQMAVLRSDQCTVLAARTHDVCPRIDVQSEAISVNSRWGQQVRGREMSASVQGSGVAVEMIDRSPDSSSDGSVCVHSREMTLFLSGLLSPIHTS